MTTARCITIVSALLLAQPPAAKAQGWQAQTTTGFTPEPGLYVNSAERNARLVATCYDDPDYGRRAVSIRIDMTRRLAPSVSIGARTAWCFEAASSRTAVVQTPWISRAGEGYPSSVSSDAWGWFADRLIKATAFQVELRTYGRANPVATFKIPNGAVLDRFVDVCQKRG